MGMRGEGTYVVAVCKWDVDHRWKTCLQLNVLVIPSMRQVKGRASCPLEKTRSGRRIRCIALE